MHDPPFVTAMQTQTATDYPILWSAMKDVAVTCAGGELKPRLSPLQFMLT